MPLGRRFQTAGPNASVSGDIEKTRGWRPTADR